MVHPCISTRMLPPRVPRPTHSKAPPVGSPCEAVTSWLQSGKDASVMSSTEAMSVVGAVTGSRKTPPGANSSRSRTVAFAPSARRRRFVQSSQSTSASPSQ